MNFDAHLTLWILSLEMQDAEDRLRCFATFHIRFVFPPICPDDQKWINMVRVLTNTLITKLEITQSIDSYW